MSSKAETTVAITDGQRTEKLIYGCKSLQDVLKVREKAESIRYFCKVANLGLETQNRAAFTKIAAERFAGLILNKLESDKSDGGAE